MPSDSTLTRSSGEHGLYHRGHTPARQLNCPSHAVDGKLARALRAALHRFARPWNRVRALRAFRDQTDLAASPGLWSSIEQALADSEFFILLASPEAANSPWVARETDYWRRRREMSKLLIVLTDGALVWDPAARDFGEGTNALPQTLQGAFGEEPLYVDLRWARHEDHLSLNHPRFRDSVANIAATLHGRGKDELVGEDVRQHRRTRRLVRAGVATLTALTPGGQRPGRVGSHRAQDRHLPA